MTSIFPWSAKNFSHTSVTSEIASSQQQSYYLKVLIDEFESNNFDEELTTQLHELENKVKVTCFRYE